MERPKCAAAKVKDFRRYHLSGDLNETLAGRVDNRITQFEMSSSMDKLQKALQEEKENSRCMMEDLELARIRNDLEKEKMKQKEWQTAMDQLKETREHMEQEHSRMLTQIKEKVEAARQDNSGQILNWFQSQVSAMTTTPGHTPN